MEKRNAEAFAEQADACRKRSCLVARCRNWPCVPHHVRTRGAGGKDADTVPLCWEHHEAAHGPGFEEKHGLDLAEEAAKLGAELERRRGHDCEAFAVLREDASKESSRYVCDRCGCVLPDAQEGPDA